jgi:hypothetical protein
MKLFFCFNKNQIVPVEPEPDNFPIGYINYEESEEIRPEEESEEKYSEIDNVLNKLNIYIVDLFKDKSLYLANSHYLSIKLLGGKINQLLCDYEENDRKIYNKRKNFIMTNFYIKINRLFCENQITIDKELFKNKGFYECLKNPYNKSISPCKFSFEE